MIKVSLHADTLDVLGHLEDRLVAACSQITSCFTCTACLSLILRVLELQRPPGALQQDQRVENVAGREERGNPPENDDRAGSSNEAEQPDEMAPRKGSGMLYESSQDGLKLPMQTAAKASDAVPSKLLAALPNGLCSAIVSGSGAAFSNIAASHNLQLPEAGQATLRAVEGLLIALPLLVKPFLEQLPQTCRSDFEHSDWGCEFSSLQ